MRMHAVLSTACGCLSSWNRVSQGRSGVSYDSGIPVSLDLRETKTQKTSLAPPPSAPPRLPTPRLNGCPAPPPLPPLAAPVAGCAGHVSAFGPRRKRWARPGSGTAPPGRSSSPWSPPPKAVGRMGHGKGMGRVPVVRMCRSAPLGGLDGWLGELNRFL